MIIPKLETPPLESLESNNGWPRYSDTELARRHAALRDMMDQNDLEAVVIGGATGILETSVQYFCNWPPLVESYVIVPRNGESTLFVRLWNHLPDAERISLVKDVRYGGDTPVDQAEAIAKLLKKAGYADKRVGMIGPIRYADVVIFQRDLPSVTWIDLNADYRDLRLIKSDEEMVFTRIASTLNDEAVAAMEAQIHPGMREFEIARVIEDVYLDQRGVNLIHFVLSTPMDDPQVCVPHQYHPDRVLREGDVVVTEISTTLWGYAGQILRSFTVAAEPTQLYQELYDVAMQAYEDITSVLKTGVRVGEILDKAEAIHRSGYSIWDDLVHGFGGAYLPPILRTRSNRGATHPDDYAYKAGTVLVVQPNVITLDNKAGVQVGNALRITDEGAEVLQEYPMKFIRCS